MIEFTGRAHIRCFNEDCMPAMEKMKENEYNLAITDPPYGIKNDGQRGNIRGKKSDRKEWKKSFK